MVTHYLMGKRVSWNEIVRVKFKTGVDFFRKINYGTVKDVSQCGGLCLIFDDEGNKHEVETPEVEEI